MTQQFSKTLLIQASPAAVWDSLTQPDLMKHWMAEPEMELEIITNWKVGSPILIKGFHHIRFENKGTVLQVEPQRLLQYTHLSSLSRLPDQPENYSTLEFRVAPVGDQTSLTLLLYNFPTASIEKHLEFYWSATLEILKRSIEQPQD